MKFASVLAVFAVALGAYAQEAETKEVPKTLGIETTFMPADCPNKAKTGDAIQVHYVRYPPLYSLCTALEMLIYLVASLDRNSARQRQQVRLQVRSRGF